MPPHGGGDNAGQTGDHAGTDARRIALGHILDEGRAGKRRPRGDTEDHVERVLIAEAAERRQDDAGHQGRVQTVDVDREHDWYVPWHCRQGRGQALPVNVSGSEQPGSPDPGVLKVARPDAAGPTSADLDQMLHVRQLGGAAHGAGKAIAFPVDLVPPIDVGIDLDNGDWPVKGFKHGDRHGIIPAQHQRYGATVQERAHRFGDSSTVRRAVLQVARQISDIDQARPGEHRVEGIEIELPGIGAIPFEGGPDRRRRTGGMTGRTGSVRCAMGRAEYGNIGLEPVQGFHEGDTTKRRVWFCSLVRSRHHFQQLTQAGAELLAHHQVSCPKIKRLQDHSETRWSGLEQAATSPISVDSLNSPQGFATFIAMIWSVAAIRRCRTVGIALAVLVMLGALLPTEAKAQRIIRDAEIEDTIRIYATPIFQAAGLSPRSINVYIVQDRSLNAFVTNGLQMFIHTGLLMESEDPLQVIGVIAHETGHIAGGHIVGRIEEVQNAQAKSLLTYLLGIGAAIASGRPEAGAAIIVGGQDVTLKSLLSYTRGQEQAADQAAVRYLEATGQSPEGLLEFMELLGDQEVLLAANQDPYLRTHPLTRDRVSFLEQAVAKSPKTGRPADPQLVERHNRMRAKLIGFLDRPRNVARAYPETDQTLPARYARAISTYRQGDLPQAIEMTDELLAEWPDDPYFHELKGQMLFEHGKLSEALPAYETAISLRPDSPQIRLSLAQVQIESNRSDLDQAALDNLEEVLRREPQNAFAWRLAATAHGRLGDIGMTALSLSENALLRGRFEEAIQQAKRAQGILPEYSASWLRAQDVENLAKRLRDKQRN